MSHPPKDLSALEREHNTARYFVQNRQIAWVILIATMVWGAWAYVQMPKR